MTIEINEAFGPHFDFRPYERDCPRQCDGRVTFHYSRIHYGTHAKALDNAHSIDIITKCHQCGHLDTAQPPITKAQYAELEHLWGDVKYLPWSAETGDGDSEIDDVYDDDEAEYIRERLEELGYI